MNSQLPEQAVVELVKLSDELNINERLCVYLWSQVNATICVFPCRFSVENGQMLVPPEITRSKAMSVIEHSSPYVDVSRVRSVQGEVKGENGVASCRRQKVFETNVACTITHYHVPNCVPGVVTRLAGERTMAETSVGEEVVGSGGQLEQRLALGREEVVLPRAT